MVDAYNRWVPDYPGQTPQADAAYMNAVRRGVFPTINTMQQWAAPAYAPTPQPVTPPTIHADLVQIGDMSETDAYQARAGAPLGFITRDENKIVFKTVGKDGAQMLDVYVRQPPEPAKPAFDPSDFVHKADFERMVEEVIMNRAARQRPTEVEE